MSKARWTALILLLGSCLLWTPMVFSLAAWSLPGPLQEELEKAPFELDERIEPPVRLSGPAPVYTETARKEGIEGIVRVRAIISEEGRVESLEALEELSHGLTEAAMDAIREWRFEPATLEGEPVSVFFEVTVKFRLDGHEKNEA